MRVDPRFERSVRRWLLAYPRRWRVARGDEVLGTLVDLAPAGAARLDRRSALGLVVGGLRTRVRTGPPPHQRFGYLFGARVSPRYLDWMADDLAARLPTVKLGLRLALVAIWSWPYWWKLGAPNPATAAWVTAVLVWTIAVDVSGAEWRRVEGRRLLLPLPGDPPGRPRWVDTRVPRTRVAARLGWTAFAVLVGWLTVNGAVGWLVSPRRVLKGEGTWAFAAALVLGLLLTVLVTRRWRRRAGSTPAQPDRVVRAERGRAVLGVGGLGALASGWIALEMSGRYPAVASTVLVLAGLAVLPAAVAGWRRAAASPEGTAAVDLLRVAVTGRAPKRDRRVLAAVPAGSPEARGTSLVDLVRVDPDRPALGGA